ncbi:2195_t:CDS:2 [Dentiscutata heterogama]|uniref:2195_t:CDS:1 n=1 Tax=Dentiscutata heterogama TaxID=1316150 RepID=A0ACA9KL40_9GLOM|nr:2195_t:CDS:2 [Dentiscutata heterogama]
MYLSILLGVVCDQDVAKQQNYTSDDFINRPKEDLKDFTTKNVFRIISETYTYIPYSSDCPFTTHNVTLCFKFKNKIDICLLNRNVKEPKPDNKPVVPENNNPDELMDKPKTNKPDEPIDEPETDKPDKPIDEPETKPDYNLIFALEISNSLKLINKKIKLINAKKEFDKIAKKIKNEKDGLKLDADIKDEINFDTKYITEDQKKELHKLHEFFIGNLLDGKLHDLLINVSRLTEKQKNKLQQALKDQLITVINKIFDDLKNNIETEHYAYQLEDEDKLYDIIKEIIEKLENLDELFDQSELAKDIFELNQILLTGDQNNTTPIRNDRGTTIIQINFIINEYKKTLNADDLKKFGRVQTNNVCNKIQKTYNNAKDEKTLLDILYYIWVLDKDDQFLLSKKYTIQKINEAKKLANDINKYLYTVKTKKLKQQVEFTRLKKNNEFPIPKSRPKFMSRPEKFD